MPDFSFELAAHADEVVVGVDEVGRGCIAGPVVSSAVVFPNEVLRSALAPGDLSNWWGRLDDSKKLSPKLREILAAQVREHCAFAVGSADSKEIDRINILQAAMLSMRRALAELTEVLLRSRATPAQARGNARLRVLVDGNMDPLSPKFGLECLEWMRSFESVRVQTIVKGDGRSFSIAAASVVAKVHRDAWMREFDAEFPGYGFAEHKGYLAPKHLRAVEQLGPCAIHRFSFSPISRSFGQTR